MCSVFHVDRYGMRHTDWEKKKKKTNNKLRFRFEGSTRYRVGHCNHDVCTLSSNTRPITVSLVCLHQQAHLRMQSTWALQTQIFLCHLLQGLRFCDIFLHLTPQVLFQLSFIAAVHLAFKASNSLGYTRKSRPYKLQGGGNLLAC